jgi:MFS family permease
MSTATRGLQAPSGSNTLRSSSPLPEKDLLQVYAAKGARVFYSALLSILIPQYLLALGYPAVFIGIVLVAILAGNVVSNLAVTWLGNKLGKRSLLQVFSLMMAASGVGLAASTSQYAILLFCFLGNISTTGAEAGPFQSIESGVLPELSGRGPVESFGKYNLIGYGASALGALAAGAPGVVPGGLLVFQGVFLGFAMVGVFLLLLYSSLRSGSFSLALQRPSLVGFGAQARKDLTRLSLLFSVDAFGGSFVSIYVLSSWFILSYGVSSGLLGAIFSATNIIVVVSIYAAARIAKRLGNLRTMVSTHLLSNVFLVAIPLAGSLAGALLFLFLRQSLSQMDVPTRQALMSEMFQKDERVSAFALTNAARSVSGFLGGPLNAVLLGYGLLSGLLYTGGFSKIVYDLAIYSVYRKRSR